MNWMNVIGLWYDTILIVDAIFVFRGQDDFSFQIFPEPQDMFRHFEEQFMRTFQGFGMMEFPSSKY